MYNIIAGENAAGEGEMGVWWWDIVSAMWLFIASVVMINLLIALMSDRYANLYLFL